MGLGVIESQSRQGAYPELEGARILITGLEADHGVDIARAFADLGCRLVLQTRGSDTELDIVLEMLAGTAQELKVSEAPITDTAAALKLAQSAAQAYGGLEAVINLARLHDSGLQPDAGPQEIEDRLAATLGGPFHITDVIANRMQLTWTEGLILNILTQGRPETPSAAELGRIGRAALAALTRKAAERWSDKAVRINAIVPAAADGSEPGAAEPGLTSEPEIAALALHLAGRRGRALSGLVFDAGSP